MTLVSRDTSQTMQCLQYGMPCRGYSPAPSTSHMLLLPASHSTCNQSTQWHGRRCPGVHKLAPAYRNHAVQIKTAVTHAGPASLDTNETAASAEAPEDQDDEDDEPSFSTAVVRIKVVKDLPRFDMPLLLGSVLSLTRTAVAVQYQGQQLLLTTASSVVYSSDIKVYVSGQDTPFKAQVAHLAMEADLAVLRIVSTASVHGEQAQALGPRRRLQRGSNSTTAAATFWRAVCPMELGDLPSLGTSVQVLAASEGDHAAARSKTARVACIEAMSYPLASYRLLGVSLSGAAAGKEWLGSPAVNTQGRCIGLVFQHGKGTRKVASRRGRRQSRSEDLLHVVPAPVIKNVLDGILEKGRYMGFSQLGIRYKHLDSPALRAYLGMQPEQQGVLVLDVNPTAAACKQLHVGDVIMTLQGEPIGNDGSMVAEHGGRIAITHKVAQLTVGSTAKVLVLRQGQPTELTIQLDTPHRLLPSHLSGTPPSFLLVGGLVLTMLSVPYLEQSFGPHGRWMRMAPPRLLAHASKQPWDRTEQVVVVAHCSDAQGLQGYRPELVEHQQVVGFTVGKDPMLTSSQAKGASGLQQAEAQAATVKLGSSRESGTGVQHESGLPEGMQRVHDLRQLAAAVLACRDGEVWLALGDGTIVVQSAAQAAADARALLAEYEVPAPVSSDLQDLLPSRKGTSGQAKRSLAVAGRR